MLAFPGGPSLSSSRISSLLPQLQKDVPALVDIKGIYVHYVQPASDDARSKLEDPHSDESQVLQQILDQGDEGELSSHESAVYARLKTRVAKSLSHGDASVDKEDEDQNTLILWSSPRPGTISPWSSKATDISRTCTLGEVVERIERGEVFAFEFSQNDGKLPVYTDLLLKQQSVANHLFDRMTHVLTAKRLDEKAIFERPQPAPIRFIDLIQSNHSIDSPSESRQVARRSMQDANAALGLALSTDEIEYLLDSYQVDNKWRSPTDLELFTFSQVNSEHCRHKVFNATWTLEDESKGKSSPVPLPNTLFSMIRNTHRHTPQNTLSAYSDNAAVITPIAQPPWFTVAPPSPYHYAFQIPPEFENRPGTGICIKVESHNHPTSISPFPGSGTGSGGEIRDEAAVGRGSRPKASLVGFAVTDIGPYDDEVLKAGAPKSHAWGKPSHVASGKQIMLEAPLGSSEYNNEFGRPTLCGFFRTLGLEVEDDKGKIEYRGYHKPVMLAGGHGTVLSRNMFKDPPITPGAKLVVLGGPGMLIGLGGGAASSLTGGASKEDLDFKSVQRGNAELERRCMAVIDGCASLALGDRDLNPIQSIHDVGAGGLSNALPELVRDSNLGAEIDLRAILVDDHSMSPMEIWCNESQERFVLALDPSRDALERFHHIATRERCPFSFVGQATTQRTLILRDPQAKDSTSKEIVLDMDTLFGRTPKMSRKARRTSPRRLPLDLKGVAGGNFSSVMDTLTSKILRIPSVASKSFLITIGDRSISGLVVRDQMVGPWQVPVADAAVTRQNYGFDIMSGEVMAMGERPALALLSPAGSVRMAVGEAITNLACADVQALDQLKLSANWMCAAGHGDGTDGDAMYQAAEALGVELCPELDVAIPVGKDSMSMTMRWTNELATPVEVVSPMTVAISAFAPVGNVDSTWTPQLMTSTDGVTASTLLVLLDIPGGKTRLGGSALAQAYDQLGNESPDLDSPNALKSFFIGCQAARARGLILAYHDRSDGGLFTTCAEMAFAGRVGFSLDLDNILAPNSSLDNAVESLFNEELGAVVQIAEGELGALQATFSENGFYSKCVQVIGRVNSNRQDENISIKFGSEIWSSNRRDLQQAWSAISFHMQSIRDNPETARQEHGNIAYGFEEDPGLSYKLTFDPAAPIGLILNERPKVAILREQGVNGHLEMAHAFFAAGFNAVDVHMSDILSGLVSLSDFKGVAACGGFSYGDVLGAGRGWAQSILLNKKSRREFDGFLRRTDTFLLGICNGCQLLGHLRQLLPPLTADGTVPWPLFKRNASARFEGRSTLVSVAPDTPSIFLRSMQGSVLPVPVAHGEGRAFFSEPMSGAPSSTCFPVRYVANQSPHDPTTRYPYNPNGSPDGIAAVTSANGRVLAMMPHPERATTWGNGASYFPKGSTHNGQGPWLQMFFDARRWVG